jgi:cytochrome oxidase assembly protein ShyY1
VWEVARRPRWIASLILALVIASGFAALGQWQVARSVSDTSTIPHTTEKVVPLSTMATPQGPVSLTAAEQMVSFTGTIVPGDSTILSDRLNGGVAGYWVMEHVVVDGGASIAVAVGWAPSAKKADAAAAALDTPTSAVPFVGRYLPSEPPDQGNYEQGQQVSASVAALINEWKTPPTSVYGGYLVSSTAPAGLAVIDNPKPVDEVSVNWLNIFYAIEWAVFAVFAVFLWYRLVRDTWEREQEEAAELAAELAASTAATSDSELR